MVPGQIDAHKRDSLSSWLTIRRLFVVNGIGCGVLILLATFMGFETDSGAASTWWSRWWAALLGTALVLVGVGRKARTGPATREVAPTRADGRG